MEGKGEEEEVGVEPPPAVNGDPLDTALGPPEGTPTEDEGERVEEKVGSCVPLPPPLLVGEGAPGVGVESRGGEGVKSVDGVGKEEKEEPFLPPLVGVASIKGERLGLEEEDKYREAVELKVLTRPGEAVFPPRAGDGEGESVPPPTAKDPVGPPFEAEGDEEIAGERDTEVVMEGEGEARGEAVVESYPLPPLRLVLLTATDEVTQLEELGEEEKEGEDEGEVVARGDREGLCDIPGLKLPPPTHLPKPGGLGVTEGEAALGVKVGCSRVTVAQGEKLPPPPSPGAAEAVGGIGV